VLSTISDWNTVRHNIVNVTLNDIGLICYDGTSFFYAGTRVAVTRINASLTMHCTASVFVRCLDILFLTVLRKIFFLQESEASNVYSRG
jgi:hypothetical protein